MALNQVLGEMMHNMGQKWRGSDISLQAEGAVITLLAGIQVVHGHGKRLAESHDWVKNQGSPTCMLRMMDVCKQVGEEEKFSIKDNAAE